MLLTFSLLLAAKYRIATDSLIVSSMCGTRTGRLFMCGRNGALYEFEYEHEDRLHSTPFADVLPCTRRRKARKTDHSNGFFSGVLGAFLSFIVPVTEDPIRQITIDETNPHVTLLWTLAKSGCVRCFDLGPKGDTTLAKWSLSGSQVRLVIAFQFDLAFN
jgi:nuclear pore complex protein Nup155